MENDEFDLIKYNKNYMIFEIGGNLYLKEGGLVIKGYSKLSSQYFKIVINKNKKLCVNIDKNNFYMEDENHNLYHINSSFGDIEIKQKSELLLDYQDLNMPYCIYCLVIGIINA